MGNCIRKEPGMQWGGDDWGSPVASPEREFFPNHHTSLKGSVVDSGNSNFFTSDDSKEKKKKTSTTEVKIKITRKQLEELLSKTDIQVLTVEDVLSRLINVSDQFQSHQRSWRPALHSIPE